MLRHGIAVWSYDRRSHFAYPERVAQLVIYQYIDNLYFDPDGTQNKNIKMKKWKTPAQCRCL